MPPRPIAICGTARPERFLSDLRSVGVEIVGQAVSSDHHAYTESDIRKLQRLREQHKAGGFLTTAKDAINLAAASPWAIEALQPLVTVPLKLELRNAQASLDTMLATIAARSRNVTENKR